MQQLSQTTSPTLHSDEINAIELSDDEIYHVKWQKFLILEKERKEASRREFENQISIPWTAKELFQIIEIRLVEKFGFSYGNDGKDGKPIFVYDENNMMILQALCYYFTNNQAFEKMGEGWSLQKGIALMGNVGRGKSLIMQLFANNKRQCFNVNSCDSVSTDYAINGHEALLKYYDTPITGADYRTFYQKFLGTCFDDLGTEPTKKNFGNELNVMANIILKRYDNKYLFGFDCTHITTNLSGGAEIEANYGTRARSRFKEMFNPIILKGNDHRK